jgi:HAD superfamily hydrolase (TIGR01509 family)
VRSRAIETFIFDFFGVLVSDDDEVTYRHFASFCRDPESAFLSMSDLAEPELTCDFITLDGLRLRLSDELGLNMSYEAFEKSWIAGADLCRPIPGMHDLLTELSAHYKLLLLSNVDRFSWQAAFAEHEIVRPFSHRLLSFELGMAKPDSRIFRVACDTAGTEPSRCFFVDDKPKNVAAARALGIQAHHFRNVEVLRAELLEKGLL